MVFLLQYIIVTIIQHDAIIECALLNIMVPINRPWVRLAIATNMGFFKKKTQDN